MVCVHMFEAGAARHVSEFVVERLLDTREAVDFVSVWIQQVIA